ncbi:uncharacterized protein Bfra_006258 [Botrytis fragariae]|uniref:Uncharacterized protein n=1 Tax=Botrytis fragariae TaxID=1964551 RepID=A0A8H6B444_9HELO|nr:uncharacterized protein Bfra_006258 [Botrytis fragariae]KAF5879054.1 hypothetical protein Bfra_006258 [Botrytis fragariae]
MVTNLMLRVTLNILREYEIAGIEIELELEPAPEPFLRITGPRILDIKSKQHFLDEPFMFKEYDADALILTNNSLTIKT